MWEWVSTNPGTMVLPVTSTTRAPLGASLHHQVGVLQDLGPAHGDDPSPPENDRALGPIPLRPDDDPSLLRLVRLGSGGVGLGGVLSRGGLGALFGRDPLGDGSRRVEIVDHMGVA
jgi:hypothetical protein